MKKPLLTAGLFMTLLLLIPSESNACGDKFLVRHGSLTKARVMAGINTGSILMYRDPNTKASANALGKDLERTLVRFGNTVRVVENLEEFENALKKVEFDIVLSSYAASQAAERILNIASMKAKIVPVVEAENEMEVRSAKERYGIVIKDSDRTTTKTLIINEVLISVGKTS